MPTLKHILGNAVPLTVTFASGESITLTYRPENLTPEAIAKLQIFVGMDNSTPQAVVQDKFREYDAMIVGLIASWDLVEEDEVTPMPLTVERMLVLPALVPAFIVQAILGDMNPNSKAAQIQR